MRTKEAFFAMKTNYKPNVSNVLPFKEKEKENENENENENDSTNSYVVSVEERRQPSGCLRN